MHEPAQANKHGLAYLPPAPVDVMPKVAGIGVVAGAATAAVLTMRNRGNARRIAEKAGFVWGEVA